MRSFNILKTPLSRGFLFAKCDPSTSASSSNYLLMDIALSFWEESKMLLRTDTVAISLLHSQLTRGVSGDPGCTHALSTTSSLFGMDQLYFRFRGDLCLCYIRTFCGRSRRVGIGTIGSLWRSRVFSRVRKFSGRCYAKSPLDFPRGVREKFLTANLARSMKVYPAGKYPNTGRWTPAEWMVQKKGSCHQFFLPEIPGSRNL